MRRDNISPNPIAFLKTAHLMGGISMSKYEFISDKVWKFFCEDIEKYGYKQREGQEDMALDIADAIIDQEHIAIEAEVGIGKSFAYLVPLLYYHARYKETVIIATSTIALQEQLDKDILKVSKILGVPKARTVTVKGQQHFLCKKRFSEKIEREKNNNGNILKQIGKDITNNISDREYFNIPIPNYVWDQINIKNYGYKNCGKCLWKNSCYYYDLRVILSRFKGIVICNQDLLTIDLLNQEKHRKPIINENAKIIVIDEAHNLEEKVRNISTKSYNENKMNSILNNSTRIMSRFRLDFSEELCIASDHVELIFQEISRQIKEQENLKEEHDNDIEKFFLRDTRRDRKSVV